jgi:branched-chain amino acid transport system substrate-binding protein
MAARIPGSLALLAALIWPALTLPALAQQYDPGASDTEIRLGQTQPYSGPVSAAAGAGFATTAYFEALNKKGGINGRKITLISLDDGYSPPKTVEAVRRLVENENVLAMFGSVGTPTNAAVQKYLNGKKIPQLFVMTGASRFNDPKTYPGTIPLIPGYAAEARAMARYALSVVSNPKIAILAQHDDLGRDFVAGFKSGLGDKATTAIVSEQTYEVTDPTIENQIISAKASGANILYFAGTQKYGAMQIRLRYELGWKPLHLINSICTGVETTLKPAGFEQSEGVVSTTYLKDPFDPSWKNAPDVKEYLQWMSENLPNKDPHDISYLVGYVGSYLMAHVLEKAGSTLTRGNLLDIATHLDHVEAPLLLPGVTISTTPADYGTINKFQVQRFEGGRWVPIGSIIDGS